MAIINFTDKVALNDNPNVQDINKVKDSDINLFKQVCNQIITTLGLYVDDWSSSSTYSVGDIVIDDNRLFINLTGTNTTTEPKNDITNWQELYLINNGNINKNLVKSLINNSNSNADDETYSCDYENKHFGGVELYSGTTAGDITLSESAVNYSAIEIFYKSSDGIYGNTGKIYSPNNKNVGLFAPYNISTTCYNKYAIATINGTAISIGNQIETQLWTSIQINTGNYFTIEKVIGYK